MTHNEIVEMMLQDLLTSVSDLYGPQGLGQVLDHMKLINRARENRKEIDALEDMLASLPPHNPR